MTFATIFQGVEINETVPVGSVMSFLGTSDPVGWVICDGDYRYNTAGKFVRLDLEGIGYYDATNDRYLPPNLQGRFLYGSSDITQVLQSGGSNTTSVQLTVSHLPTHSHYVNDSGHSHTFHQGTPDDRNNTGGTNPVSDGPNTNSYDKFSTRSETTGITIGNSGYGNPFNVTINPRHYTVNYIMKC
jgi:microcystin-dependent protein